MHLVLFGLSIVVQILLASHAYRHGRLSPWVWIILFFPFVGSILYAAIFLLPKATAGSSRPVRRDLSLRKVTPGPFAARGNRADNAIPVDTHADIVQRVAREECEECGAMFSIDGETGCKFSGKKLRAVVMTCKDCGISPVRYFEVADQNLPDY